MDASSNAPHGQHSARRRQQHPEPRRIVYQPVIDRLCEEQLERLDAEAFRQLTTERPDLGPDLDDLQWMSAEEYGARQQERAMNGLDWSMADYSARLAVDGGFAALGASAVDMQQLPACLLATFGPALMADITERSKVRLLGDMEGMVRVAIDEIVGQVVLLDWADRHQRRVPASLRTGTAEAVDRLKAEWMVISEAQRVAASGMLPSSEVRSAAEGVTFRFCPPLNASGGVRVLVGMDGHERPLAPTYGLLPRNLHWDGDARLAIPSEGSATDRSAAVAGIVRLAMADVFILLGSTPSVARTLAQSASSRALVEDVVGELMKGRAPTLPAATAVTIMEAARPSLGAPSRSKDARSSRSRPDAAGGRTPF